MIKEFKKNKQGGFLQIIILIIIALLILHFLNVSLSSLLSQQTAKNITVYLWETTKTIWTDFVLLITFVKDIVTKP